MIYCVLAGKRFWCSKAVSKLANHNRERNTILD